ncbi:unnamed protein product [Owenia fusiformis]|uniref:Uncharacterized protein n=1 Tax=Owenia fusiformis TaxID=6347 RepID=A0A8J1TVY8_OWEFU|nr:unnamed protein product [Owenia fusiformis]
MTTFDSSKLLKAIKDNNTEEVKNLINGDEDTKIKNAQGETYLHVAIKSKVSKNVIQSLLPVSDITERDENGDTPYDLICDNEYPRDVEEAVDNHLHELINKGDEKVLEKLALAGYLTKPVRYSPDGEKNEDVENIIRRLPDFQDKVYQIHKAIKDGELRSVQTMMDRKIIVLARDVTGIPPLQKAVIYEHSDIIREILQNFPNAVNNQDNMGRTALHYAAASRDGGHMYNVLIRGGADETIKDVAEHDPKYYKDDPAYLQVKKLQARLSEIQERKKNSSPSRPWSHKSRSGSAKSKDGSRPVSSSSAKPTARPVSGNAGKGDSKPATPSINLSLYNRPNDRDVFTRRGVSPPETIDGKYVSEQLGYPLTMALAELADKRPWDPIEFLAQWLYKYSDNKSYEQEQRDMAEQLKQEIQNNKDEKRGKERRQKEMAEIKEKELQKQREKEEEEKRKQKEQEDMARRAAAKDTALLAQPPNLTTIKEDTEDIQQTIQKDDVGQTELHRAAADEESDIVTLIRQGHNIAERDSHGKTPRDIALEAGHTKHVEVIDSSVQELFKLEQTESIQRLVLNGYAKELNEVVEKMDKNALTEDMQEMINSIPNYLEKINDVHKAAKAGVLRDLQGVMDRKKLALSKSEKGLTPLHIAILGGHQDAAEFIIQQFPSTLTTKDNLSRTPLHYAYVISDELVELLLEAGADTNAKDIKQQTPVFYKDHKDEILKLQDD